jgi:ribulose-5-phosphate 4-epimerase/fuculose-1-phosphate aldolase
MTGITNESRLRSELVTVAESLFHRGLTAGSSGNISVRLDDGGFLMTPTNSSLGRLDGDQLSRLDAGGRHIDGGQPTKEAALHRAMHQRRPGDNAVVHLHSPHATAVSCLDGLDHRNCIPPLTAYHVMRVGPLPLVAYHRPGDPAVVAAIAAIASDCHALLLANHGPIVGESTLQRAADAIEELEQTARILLLLGDRPARPLTQAQIEELTDPPQSREEPSPPESRQGARHAGTNCLKR